MARHIIDSPHDDSGLNAINENFRILFKGRQAVTEAADDYLQVLNNSLEHFQRDSVLPVFELGGYYITGQKTPGNNPVNIRSTVPYYLRKGMVVSQDQSDTYDYELFERRSEEVNTGDFVNRTGMKPFGEEYVVEHANYFYIIIRRQDGATMTNADVTAVARLFNVIELDYNNLIDVDRLIDDGITFDIELGGWYITGDKITGENPVNMRNTEPTFVPAGYEFLTRPSSNYTYDLRFHDENGNLDYRTNTQLFGTKHVTTVDRYVRIVFAKTDGTAMTGEDVTNIRQLINPFKPVSGASDGSIVKAVDKFNIIGALEPFMNQPLTDFYPDPNAVTPQAYHDSLIALVNANSDIAKYQSLGREAHNYNMYAYRTTPNIARISTGWNTTPNETIGTPLKIPKIIITSGIHGSERNTNFVVHHFLKNLLGSSNDAYDTILNNVELVIVPMCNPSGFVDDTYNNRADVNLNRDFPPHGDVTQPESEMIKGVIDTHSDADYHIDVHNFTPKTDSLDILGYALTDDPDLARITTNVYKYLGFQWQKKSDAFPQNRNHQWGYTAAANVGTVGKYSNAVHGIPSSIIETAKWHNFIDEENHGAEQTQIGVDLLVNTIIGILQARR